MARIQSQSSRDPLTGLLTGSGWRERLEAKLKSGMAGYVMAVECDRFKAFGDGLGRAASDELLVEIAQALSALGSPGEFCARIGEAAFALWIDGEGEEVLAARTGAVTEAFRICSRRMSLALAASPIIASAIAAQNTPPARAAALTEQAVEALVSAKRPVRARGTPPCSKT
jgi:GGDEF domain-containing protein